MPGGTGKLRSSRPGPASRFYKTLTCLQSPATFPPYLRTTGGHDMTILYSERRRVLLIDENSRKLNLLATILRNHEVEVHLPVASRTRSLFGKIFPMIWYCSRRQRTPSKRLWFLCRSGKANPASALPCWSVPPSTFVRLAAHPPRLILFRSHASMRVPPDRSGPRSCKKW